jgi:hypothetical protein
LSSVFILRLFGKLATHFARSVQAIRTEIIITTCGQFLSVETRSDPERCRPGYLARRPFSAGIKATHLLISEAFIEIVFVGTNRGSFNFLPTKTCFLV